MSMAATQPPATIEHASEGIPISLPQGASMVGKVLFKKTTG
jgi:hypothetical protein